MIETRDEGGGKPRVRMTKDERRRQLVGIGLRMLTERAIQDVALDTVAQEAGISRGLLFHYFPTKTAYYEAVVAAAGRRVVRTVQPDEHAEPFEAVHQVITRFVAQIERRRAVYLALVHGNLSELGGLEVAGTLREHLTRMVVDALTAGGLAPSFPVVHGWVAYVEDRAIAWSDPQARGEQEAPDLVTHCEQALAALLALHSLDAGAGRVPVPAAASSPESTGADAEHAGPAIPRPYAIAFDLVKEMHHASSPGHQA